MNGFPELLIELLGKKETDNFKTFLETFKIEKKEWYLISDYCIDDTNKLNDVFSFSLLLNHDDIHDIKEFVKNSAPKDLKNTKDISASFLSYVNSPIVYHFSFIIPKKDKLIKSFYTKERMLGELNYLNQILENDKKFNGKEIVDFYTDAQKRIRQIQNEALRPTFNENLLRKILLTGIFGGTIVYLLKLNSNPSKVMWISDRDAIIDKFDGFAFDYMYLMYSLLPEEKLLSKNLFDFIFNPPEPTGQNFFDELIRIPDYVAGTLASIDLEDKNQIAEMLQKHKLFVIGSITNSVNQATIKIKINGEGLSVYNIKWVY